MFGKWDAIGLGLIAIAIALGVTGYNYTKAIELEIITKNNSDLEQCFINNNNTIWVKDCGKTLEKMKEID